MCGVTKTRNTRAATARQPLKYQVQQFMYEPQQLWQ